MKKVILEKEDIHKGYLILVNEKYPLNIKVNNISYVNEEIFLERKCNKLFKILMTNIDGEEKIIPISGYRSYEEQKEIYNYYLNKNGIEYVKKYVALPNNSEHQTGLAIDVGLEGYLMDLIKPKFGYNGICKEFRKQGLNLGFIERYGQEKEKITGIAHEPWHFRYVGFPHSLIINEKNFSLEEYISYIKKFVFNENDLIIRFNNNIIRIGFVEAEENKKVCVYIDEGKPYEVSGNNIDGFIITVWDK